jgi:transcriptional regulator with XRE-family HTH domain
MLRELRERAGLGVREVERLSLAIVERKNKNRDFYLPHTWISDIEQGKFRPTVFKMYSLSVIYQCKPEEIIRHFGLDLREVARDQALFGLPKTRLVHRPALEAAERRLTLPVRLKSNVLFENTNLLNRLVELWGDIPVDLLQNLDLQKSLYGLIGLNDYTMYPMLRPGTLVQIDTHQTKIKRGTWRVDFERPIYFIELRGGYACGWCEVNDNQLSVIPHPYSPVEIRRFAFPTEADVIGRVTGVAMRIADRTSEAAP